MGNTMNIGTTGRPYMLFKVMEFKYIKKMYDDGEMRFYCPKKWIEQEKTYGKGQGDLFEGCFAKDCGDDDREKSFRKKYGKNLIVNQKDGYKYYQLNSTISCPVFCLYSMTDDILKHNNDIDEAGYGGAYVEVSGDYFKDFAKNMKKEEWDSLPDEEKPVLLIVFGEDNVKQFYTRVRQALRKEHGLCDSNIHIDQVEYGYSRSDGKSFISSRNHPPLELFYKGSEFDYQHEARIVINSKNHKIDDYQKDYIDVHIGSLHDIAQVKCVYPPDGMKITLFAHYTQIKDYEQVISTKRGYEGI